MVGSNVHAWIRPSILTNICMLVREKYIGQDRRGLTKCGVLWELRVPRGRMLPAALCPNVPVTSVVLRGGLPWAGVPSV